MSAPFFRPRPPIVVTLAPEKNIAGADASGPAGAGKTQADPGRADDDTGSPEFRVACRPGQTLAQAIYLSGHVASPALCSGLGACGRCRVRVIGGPRPEPVAAESRLLRPEEIALGWRLACKHPPVPGMRVELPDEARRFSELLTGRTGDASGSRESTQWDTPLIPGSAEAPALSHASPFHASDGQWPGMRRPAEAEAAFLAVDLGTTSLEWRLLSPRDQGFRVLWQGKAVNPQMGAGSDVVSRLSFAAAPEGRARLSALTREALRSLVEQSLAVMRAYGLSGGDLTLCLAANTAMTAITLGLDTTSLASAPYSLPYAGGQWETPPGLPRIWTPPQLSPFVGGDISAGYAALALDPEAPPPAYPFLLADLGTNGEFLLALTPDKALAASVALGPALEGIGLSHGTEARPGAVSDFSLGPRGLEAFRLPNPDPDDAAPEEFAALRRSAPAPSRPGITGTGYLALLHILLTSGAMDRQGRFTPDNCGPLKRFLTPVKADAAEEPRNGDWLPLPFDLRLTARDVEEMLKVKAAFSLGLRRLLDQAGLASRDLARVCVAGALGGHVNKRALENLGFFPPGMESRLDAVGNTSLSGAALLLRNPDVRPALVRWAATVRTLDLASDPIFRQNFTDQMRFIW